MQSFTLATVKTEATYEPVICVSDRSFYLRSLLDLPLPLRSKATVKDLLDSWHDSFSLLVELAERLVRYPQSYSQDAVLAASVAFETPIRFPNKLLCVGANYASHLREMGVAPEKMTPMPFFSRPPTTSLVGPGRTVRKPRSTSQLDWEVELVIVVGKCLRHATSLDEASSAIAGFSVGLDLSCRDLQMVKDLGMDVSRGKAQDTLAPVGPVFVPKEFIQEDFHDLGIKLFVNGEKMMDARTNEMLYSLEEQLLEISKYTTLEPGDLVFTGAPAGSAKAHGQRWLQVGDKIRAEIEGVGVLDVEVTEDD
ncbi:hypothetical protein H2198_006042 [Neophaeococcomyces mojaviensis]|uniref:Uncharacterized protein n=1 Tax=Neophaeococcomyces mojaviensis TaxID=3383035 RepID=A0ACC3A4F7_9EURO|nr:hypothetical protein H2198_006042 [Knufia sp. JES_112]